MRSLPPCPIVPGITRAFAIEHGRWSQRALGIAAEILLLSAKDCSGKPDPKGNANKKTIAVSSQEAHATFPHAATARCSGYFSRSLFTRGSITANHRGGMSDSMIMPG